MKLIIDINDNEYISIKEYPNNITSYPKIIHKIGRWVKYGIPLEDMIDKIKDEIMDCLNALDSIEKSGPNIFLPNEISGRRLTYQQCLEILDKYKSESEE